MRYPLIAAVAFFAIAEGAFAAGAQDAAYDKNAGTVRDSSGNCVRTKWQGANDACGAAPKRVAAPVSIADVTLEQRTVYFDFNSAVLKPAGKQKLDQLASVINRASDVSDVRIHGYTDQLGTSDYNNALANKRAAAVRSYLGMKSRLPVALGEVRGLGKAEPQEQCAALARAAKIACMASERRVEIELKATN